jgi:sugar phosphate isomerase/epimerase
MEMNFKLGVTTFSLRPYQRRLAIEMIQALKTPYVSVKEFHLPYHDTAEQLARGRREFEQAGLQITSGGTITFARNDAADFRKYFDYAKACGMPMIVCVATRDNISLMDRFVKEYDIQAAIMNRADQNFPTPQSVLDATKDMDPRVGLCMDTTRASGEEVVGGIAAAGRRLLDMHMKDRKPQAEGGGACDVGDGIVPVVAIFKELAKTGYTGCVNLEDELETDTPLPGLMKSFAYMRGVMAGLKG